MNVAELSHALLALLIKDGFKSRVQKGTRLKFVNMLIHSDEEHLCTIYIFYLLYFFLVVVSVS